MEFDVIGELSDDCQYIRLHHFKMLRSSILKNYLGKTLDVRIRLHKEKRSDAQNRYLHGVVIPKIMAWLKDTKGEIHDPASTYAWVKERLLGVKPELKTILGEKMIVFKELSFSKMNTAEFSKYTDLIIAEMALRGCPIPKPTKNNNLHDFIDDSLNDDYVMPVRVNPKVSKKMPEGVAPPKPIRRVVEDDDIDDL